MIVDPRVIAGLSSGCAACDENAIDDETHLLIIPQVDRANADLINPQLGSRFIVEQVNAQAYFGEYVGVDRAQRVRPYARIALKNVPDTTFMTSGMAPASESIGGTKLAVIFPVEPANSRSRALTLLHVGRAYLRI